MYSKPIIYKIYSVLIFVLLAFCGIGSLISALLGGFFLNQVLPETGIGWLYILVIAVCTLLMLFFGYVEFSSMFCFAKMIEHEESGSAEPFVRPGFVLPPKFYKNFGSLMFYIPLIASMLGAVILIIKFSVDHQAFLAVPVIPLAIMAISLVLTYITYYCRYRTFGDLLEIKSCSGEPSVNTINSLGEAKPNALRSYCTLMYILAVLFMIGTIIGLFFVIPNVAAAGFGIILLVILLAALEVGLVFVIYGIMGCFYDNLAKMLEHYMMKFKLI